MNIFNKLFSRTTHSDELYFIKSDEKREIIRAFSKNLKISTKELKNLYLNCFFSVKNSEMRVKTFPVFFWLNGLFCFIQLTLYGTFLFTLIFSAHQSIEQYSAVMSSSILIYATISYAYKTMFKPIKILAKQYHFIGKYNNFSG